MSDQPFNPENNRSEVTTVSGLYEDWFLDYASYVILERAVPSLVDGLKPVQRRILHSMKQMDDGRYNKVANIIGQTMQYHPHGDASIEEALVNLGQKDLLIDCQGNWGDNRTGDRAAAARYIEARLSKFALDVAFNPQTTEWQLSYDGRKKEPVDLPMKFPLLLYQGVEGIAVGLATKIMPHNFVELVKASISTLKGRTPKIYPDFLTGGTVDVTNYNDGLKGGKIKVRATIEVVDKKTLAIKDIPYGVTTTTLIDSIVKANDKGKIKIKRIVDNTAELVEILIELPPNVSPQLTIDALYAFTNCEVSISPNSCVIETDTPRFLGMTEILKRCTAGTVELLRLELQIKLAELQEKWHMSSLEKIFIENRIYRDIEECETWEEVITTIDKGLTPFKKQLFREVTEEDIIKLTEIKIKRISKFDSFKADEIIKKLEEQMEEVKYNLEHIIDYTIAYYERILAKHGKGRERKTQIMEFDNIRVQQVAVANQKLYVDRKGGFIGYGLKKDEYVMDCSDMADVIVIRKDMRFLVAKIDDKKFVGKDILHTAVWKKGDRRTIYHLIYAAPELNKVYVKRFAVTAITREKEYDLFKGTKKPKLLYWSVNPNGESEVVQVLLSEGSKARKKEFEFDFSTLAIKGRQAQGNVLTNYPVRKITQVSVGKSTLGGRKIWVDSVSGRLNTQERGQFLGKFNTGDLILVLYKNGEYEMTSFELTNRFNMSDVKEIKKWDKEDVISCIYYHGEKKCHFVKRFNIETNKTGQKYLFISDASRSKVEVLTTHPQPKVQYSFERQKGRPTEEDTIFLNDFIDIKGWKSLGNKLSLYKVKSIRELENPLPKKTSDSKEEKPQSEDKKEAVDKNNGQAKLFGLGDTIEWEN